MDRSNFLSLFELLPIGAYRSSVDGRQLRANAALVRLNGYDSETEMLRSVNDIANEWYVDSGRRQRFREIIERDGQVLNFRSEIYRHKTRERIWVVENAHLVRDDTGAVLFYEGTVEDVTHELRAQQALAASERRFRALTESAQVLTLVCTAPGEILYASPASRQMLGVDPRTMLGSTVFDWIAPMDLPHAQAEHALTLDARNSGTESVFRYRHTDGGLRHLASLANNCLDDDAVRGVVLNFRDVTQRVLAEAALHENDERWKLALDSTGDGIWDWDLSTGATVFSQRCKEMYGYGGDDLEDLATVFDGLTHPDDIARTQRNRQEHFEGRTAVYVDEYRVRCKDGSWKWVLSRGMVIRRDAQGKPLRMIGTHTDITDRKTNEALVWQQANFDALTGLPNRRMLRDRLDQEIRKCHRDGLQLAILFIDLDQFKEVNDTLGHDAGDQLLVEATRRVRACVRDTDTVARMGGDEFTIMIPDLAHGEVLERILGTLLETLAMRFQIGTEQVYISASIGITVYPVDGTEVEMLFKNADQALYAAKGAGRNRFSFFTPALQTSAMHRVRLTNDLRSGLAQHQFRVAYQPIVDLRTGAVHKAEALIRWDHPVRGAISPAEFIPVAESSGLILEIGEWVFRQAAARARAWRERHHPAFQISINKSPVQFHDTAGRHQTWITHLRELGLAGEAVVLEITEGMLLDTNAAVTTRLRELRETGIRVSLDDFGTGYSSLTYLQKLDIDYVKIDQSFVRNLAPGSTELALCKAIIVMAHELGMQVIAEGVETEEQRGLLVAAGCDHAQGYLFAHPMDADSFEDFLTRAQRPLRTG